MVIRSALALAMLCSAVALPAEKKIDTLASVAPTPKSEKRMFVADGRRRLYLFYRPRNLPLSKTAPLVVMLHGRFDHAAYAELAYHWDQTADANGFLVAYPQGYGRTWNAGHCCGGSRRNHINEVAFLDALIRSLMQTENADPARIYIAGMSNGALMAYRMACESTVPLAAIGSVNGTRVFECPSPRPNSIIEIHGSKDRLLPFLGRGTPQDADYIPSVPATMEIWRKLDDCEPFVRTESASGIVDSRATCPHGREVELTELMGAGHQWPGGRPHLPILHDFIRLDQPDDRMDATKTLWQFFAPLKVEGPN